MGLATVGTGYELACTRVLPSVCCLVVFLPDSWRAVAGIWGRQRVTVPAFTMPRTLTDKATASPEDSVSLDGSALSHGDIVLNKHSCSVFCGGVLKTAPP